jgi:hypothetical protein
MPFTLFSNSAPSGKIRSDRESQFRRHRFQKEQTSVCGGISYIRPGLTHALLQPPFLTRQRTLIGTLFNTAPTQSNEGESRLLVRSKSIVIISFTTLWVICVALCAMSTDFAFDVSPPPLLPFKFRVFTSRMDIFADSRLPTSFKWMDYHIEVYFGRRPHPEPLASLGPSPSPILDYASISAGGRPIETLTSPTYSPHRKRFAFLRVAKDTLGHSPIVALTDGMERGRCWALRGDSGQIGIQLTQAIDVSSLVIGHANVSSTASAPKKLVLWGLKPTGSDICDTLGDVGTPTPDFGSGYCGIRLLSGVYDPSISTLYQNFTLSPHSDRDHYDRMIVQVLENWGHPTFTCIYRIQIYGNAQ